MAGSTSLAAPSAGGPMTSLPSVASNANAFADARLKGAQAAYYESEAAKNRNETPGAQAETSFKNASAAATSAQAEYYRQKKLTEEQNTDLTKIHAALDNLTLKLKESPVLVPDGKGNTNSYPYYVAEGLVKVAEYGRILADTRSIELKNSKFPEYAQAFIDQLNASAKEKLQNASITEAKQFAIDANNEILKGLKESGTLKKSAEKEFEAKIEKFNRYIQHEFDGSTSEFWSMWISNVCRGLDTAAGLYGTFMTGGLNQIGRDSAPAFDWNSSSTFGN